MLRLYQSKVAGLSGEWACYPGFSLLFDNPGTSYRSVGEIEIVDCNVHRDSALELYKAFDDGLNSIGRSGMFWNHSVGFLPTASYHVTVFDGGNIGDLSRANPTTDPRLADLLLQIAVHSDLDLSHPLIHPVDQSARLMIHSPVKLKFNCLTIWPSAPGNPNVLVAELEPTAASATAFAHLDSIRAALSARYRDDFGFGAGPNYSPHVSLGYFLEPSLSPKARAQLQAWDSIVRASTNQLEISFESVSVHGFTDMATFFRKV